LTWFLISRIFFLSNNISSSLKTWTSLVQIYKPISLKKKSQNKQRPKKALLNSIHLKAHNASFLDKLKSQTPWIHFQASFCSRIVEENKWLSEHKNRLFIFSACLFVFIDYAWAERETASSLRGTGLKENLLEWPALTTLTSKCQVMRGCKMLQLRKEQGRLK